MTTKYKLVPVEPTEEMVIAGIAMARMDVNGAWILDARDCFNAMIAAAPSRPHEPYKVLEVAREALELMDAAWEELIPNLKNGVVQNYELVLTKAPTACTKALNQINQVLGDKEGK